MKNFSGFPKDLFPFLRELSRNNNREWFLENKPRYQQAIVEPGKAFITAIGEQLGSVSNHFIASPKTNGGSMFRIYRDARFSNDKRPYKENIGFHFRHERARDAHAPGFYVHIEPKLIFLGAGIWMPPAPALSKIREFIDDNPNAWKKARDHKNIKARFSGIEGDSLIRPPRGYAADHPLIDDLKRKSFFVKQELKPQLANSEKLVDEAIASFQDATPLMRYICMALDVDF
jgi:uncharacterized protein (TIGR02453 family)